jgi:hypothetical protein
MFHLFKNTSLLEQSIVLWRRLPRHGPIKVPIMYHELKAAYFRALRVVIFILDDLEKVKMAVMEKKENKLEYSERVAYLRVSS